MRGVLLAAAALTAMPAASRAQGWLPPILPAGAPIERDAIPLGTGGVIGARAPESWFALGGGRMVRNVSRATLTPVLPDPAKATGAAAVVLPGGAFMMLSMDGEGWVVARWLADHGIAAFVLKYRLRPTPSDARGFQAEMGALFARPPFAATEEVGATPTDAVEDALAAMRLVRSRAVAWGVDPARVGMIGFSAGAMTTLEVARSSDASSRPAFIAPIYPPMGRRPVASDAPPMFVALAMDDPLFGRMGYGLVEGWQAAGRPVELHVYQRGGHGFGAGVPGTTTVYWLGSLRDWLGANGLLGAAS